MALLKVVSGEEKRLIVTMPPRHSKSETISKNFAAWFVCHFKEKQVILTSYEADFAASWGRKALDVAIEWGMEVFGVKPRTDVASGRNWQLKGHDGAMHTAGVGGAITGKGAHLLIVDDPIKNAEEARSKRIRDKCWDWWCSTAYTRLEPGGAAIVIQTRWHEEDLAGKLISEMEEGSEDWTVLNLPAIAMENDTLGREMGEALWPERYPVEELMKMKRTVGSYWWNALYQQTPSPDEGNIFKRSWFKYYDKCPENFDVIIHSWDMAFKGADDSDYVVGQVWGMNYPNKYLIDQVRVRADFVETIQLVKCVLGKHPDPSGILVEDKANGPAVISSLKDSVAGVVAINPKSSKEARAFAVSPSFEAHNIHIPSPDIAPWVMDYVEELIGFPNAANDDQVDATSQALEYLNGFRGKAPSVDAKPKRVRHLPGLKNKKRSFRE